MDFYESSSSSIFEKKSKVFDKFSLGFEPRLLIKIP
jgi:hypothetical protein